MLLKSIIGNPASRVTRTLKLNMQLGNKVLQGGSRTYRTTMGGGNRSMIRAVDGAPSSRTTLPKFSTNSTVRCSSRATAPIARSFGSVSKQFTLPNGQVGPIAHPTRLSSPHSILQQAINLLRPRQKGNFSTRTHPSQSRKIPNSRQRFSTTRSKRKPEEKTKSDSTGSGLGARMRRLSREYGWSAIGVYFLLSALDFPFCYLLVKYLGTDRIGTCPGFF